MANEKKIDYVLLGLLSHEPLSGYEIKKRLDSSISFFWGASFGSIYPCLQHLEKEEKIKSTRSQDTGREKIIYEITPLGLAYLKDWLQKPVVKDELRYETLLKLFFGGKVGPTITLEHIKAFEDKFKDSLDHIKESVNVLEQIDSEVDHLYFRLTALFAVKTFEAYLEWCKEVKEYLIKEGEKNV